ncbi:hypothetical protein HBH70_098130 [Parastagonospora nodorum]|nr:hypothetical protein HBH53_067030 [Parastagonospora nodorum]KAH5037702.1 hypothetical protein HBI75_072740 [Parastagonospora nodorum]KAH5074684.1 hypothetical protein HBH95_142290 [Parastagonospora nodorum]KAH5138915.1 hypothetical protein HBH70_098130 [Parastagonospora nodorum]KAH5267016.1 hypothetical protein HBI72_081330 [Parastagonospora nodorum]
MADEDISEEVYFEPFNSPTLPPFIPTPSASKKPADDFSTLPLGAHTLFYLAIIAPHTDTYEIHGPATSFSHLLPRLEDVVSNSPRAIDKLEAIRNIEDVWGDKETNLEFAERGFGTFVVEGQRGIYTVLKILREENRRVREELPAPVYVVSAHGPLVNEVGYVATTRLVGAFVGQRDAKGAAVRAMDEMVQGRKVSKRSEYWGKESKGGGMLMAMGAARRWEVRIAYEDQVHKRAKEEAEREGESVGWRI